VKVVGGPQAAQGSPQGGKTVLFAGSSSGNTTNYSVSNGGSLMVQDSWYEGPNQSTFALVTDRSQFTLEGSRVAFAKGNGPAIQLNNFSGNATILSNTLSSGGLGAGNWKRQCLGRPATRPTL